MEAETKSKLRDEAVPRLMRDRAQQKGLGRLMALSGEGVARLAGGVSCAVASALLQAVPYLMVFFVLAEMLAAAAQGTAPMAQANLMIGQALIACAAMAASLGLGYLASMLCHGYAFRAICGMRKRVVEHLRELPLGRGAVVPTGQTMQVVTADLDQLEAFLAHLLPDLASTMALIACLFACMFAFDALLALVALAVVAAGFAGQLVPMARLLKAGALKDNFDALERINAAATEYVRGMPSVKMFGLGPRSFLGFQRDIEAYRDFASGLARKLAPGVALFRTLVLSASAFIAPVAVALWLGHPDVGMAATGAFFLVFAPAAAMPVCKLRTFSEGMNTVKEAVGRVEAILDEAPPAVSAAPVAPQGSRITFEHVGFSYAEGLPAVLDDLTFTVPEGSLCAIVGPSGAGKSTVARLLCRFWDANSGVVTLGGADVRLMNERDLMDRLSFVFQENHLFSASIADNIRMGRPSATRADIERAAAAARCDAFASRLPQGLDTRVGEGGAGLSGGEEQRVAIARALVKDAPVLVLDEPTSSMDADTERDVQEALRELARDRTVIMVAHRLRTVTGADQILVMEGGRIVERGTHKALLASGGAYRRLWDAAESASTWSVHSGKDEK